MVNLYGAYTLDDALKTLAAEVQQNEARGERTLVFCEDRLTLLAERAVLSVNGGSFLTEVSTFRRFLSYAGVSGKTISKQASVLEVAALIGKHQDQLTCFRRNAAQAVYETIAQLSASCVTAEMLEVSAESVEGVLRRKLKDLAFLLGKYHEFLRENGLLDENGYLALLPAAIESGALKDTNVLFFAFPSFTRQAREGIRAAMRGARSAKGIFLAGEHEYYTNEARDIFKSVAEEFGFTRVSQWANTFQGECREIASTVFSSYTGREKERLERVHTFSPTDETEEMNTVAALIRKHVAEGKRYKDIAVLVGGEEYFLAVEKAFKAYRIPYYADIKRKFSEHPFCAFLLSVLEAVADGVLPDEADDIASSVYFGRSDHYRNYLLRYGAFRGGVRKEIKDTAEIKSDYGFRDDLVRCRERMRGILDLFKPKGTGAFYTDAIRKLWEFVDGKRVTESLDLPEEEQAFLDISPLENVLRETEEVVGGETFTAREFAVLLRSGLEALTVSILPQRADAVFVGDVTESKIARADILFCAGLTDALPRVSQDTAVITDGEIDRLTQLKVEIDPAIAVVNARARESLALNLAAFAEELYLSCPMRKGGKEAVRSEIFYDVERTFDVAPMPEVSPYDCCEYTPAMLAFYRDVDALEGAKEGAGIALIERFSSVRYALMHPVRGEWIATDPELLRGQRDKTETPEAGELLLGREVSPTLLEDYFACPYKGFAMRALRVSEREERTLLNSADAGSFVHTVLERVAKQFNEIESEEACRATARSLAEALLKEPYYASISDTAAGSYTGGRLIDEAEAVSAAAYRQLVGSSYRVRAAESQVTLPALGLKGKTDRVDESGDLVRVIDYKTGHIDDTPVAYYTGRRLQLQLYLRAAAEGGVSAGAFYFPAADDFCKDGEIKFRMKGFYCNDPDVMAGFDTECGEGKSSFFENGSRDKGLSREDFEDFLDYAFLVAEGAESEMRAGNITPSPYDDTCKNCKLKGMCGFSGEPRKEKSLKCGEIAEIVRREKGKGEEA